MHFEASPPLLQSATAFFTARPAPAMDATASAMSVAQDVAVASVCDPESETSIAAYATRKDVRIVRFARVRTSGQVGMYLIWLCGKRKEEFKGGTGVSFGNKQQEYFGTS